ncbi:MAG: C4-dicarboxylate ABC transporter substrate-binding protein [Rhodoferax sp.]|nr:C4-dicarboxylate ABC transporter substrate-binding protein [Rhodoferax sp.]MCB2039810.1 C4-dicarboxylate ABC transporter substrate-binding protein [Rhodoferax sp.]MCW5642807.1 C4-dicarboxylate ABC transporter substrate-binding protein [Rhodoferax sp.]
MPRTLRYTLASLRELIVSGGPFIVLAVGLLVLAYWWLDPNPPRRVTLATGPAQSAYAEIGARYQKALARSGIEVVLLPTAGSSDNLALVQQGRADIGFVQGGSRPPAEQDDTAAPLSLGNLFLEPIWLFYWEKSARQATGQPDLDNLRGLRGLRVNVGTPGSGVPQLMNSLFALNRLEPGDIALTQLAETPGTVAFLDGQSDALVFASAPESLMVQMLLQTPGVRLMDFAQNEAYVRRLPFLAPVTLPRGVVDLASDIPPADVHLVAPTTTLLARPDLHPALLQLFSQASLTLHGNAGWFNRAREYPLPANAEFPLAKEAERTIRNGVPLLQRYLPFHLANLLERMWLSLGIIVALLLPLSRIVPPLYEFRIRSRVFRWYAQLRDIEDRVDDGADTRPALLGELDALEQRVGKVVVPLSHTDELYALRNHIELVRQKLSR